MLVFSSDMLELHFDDRGGETLLITFNEMGMRADGNRYWADGLAQTLGLSATGFVSREPNWFPPDETRRAIDALNAVITSRFRRRIGYGLSQGAHAVLRYQKELALTSIIAFSPQGSIDPDDIVDLRFNGFFNARHHIDMIPIGGAMGCRSFVIYDPKIDLDRQQIALFRDRVPFADIPLPFIGHSSAVPFAVSAIMARLFQAVEADDLAAAGLQHPLQDQLLHIRRALINLAHTHIAINPLHRIIRQETVTAQGLDGGCADGFGGFGGE